MEDQKLCAWCGRNPVVLGKSACSQQECYLEAHEAERLLGHLEYDLSQLSKKSEEIGADIKRLQELAEGQKSPSQHFAPSDFKALEIDRGRIEKEITRLAADMKLITDRFK